MSEYVRVICVDLDGTLIQEDVSVDSVHRFARSGLRNLIKICCWFLKGGVPYTKYKIAEEMPYPYDQLHFNIPLISYLKGKKSAGYRIFLATGSTEFYAKDIAEQLEIFDGVYASDLDVNLIVDAKADKLSEVFGEKRFLYVGNSIDDIQVWMRAANPAIVVNPENGVLKRLESFNSSYELFPGEFS